MKNLKLARSNLIFCIQMQTNSCTFLKSFIFQKIYVTSKLAKQTPYVTFELDTNQITNSNSISSFQKNLFSSIKSKKQDSNVQNDKTVETVINQTKNNQNLS